MRYSLENEIDTSVLTIDNAKNIIPGVSALFDKRTTRSFIAEQDGAAAVEINIVPATIVDIDLVALVAVTGIPSATITLKYLTATVATEVVTLSTPVQQTYLVASFDSVEADEIVITFDLGDSGAFSIGYLFAGAAGDEIVIANDALNYKVESAYPRNLTRAGVPLTTATYLVAAVTFGIVEIAFSTLRDLVNRIAIDGFATPRVWYFDEDCILSGEALYAVFNSDMQQLDPSFYKKGSEARATAALALTEVF